MGCAWRPDPLHRLDSLGPTPSPPTWAAPHPLSDAVRAELAALAQGNPVAAVDLVVSLTPAQLVGAEPLPYLPAPGRRLGRTYTERIDRLPTATHTEDLGRAEGALRAFDRWAEATGSDEVRALAARCRALRAEGSRAEEHFEEAVNLHKSGYCDFERARTELLFGNMLRRARQVRRAREHLHAALETFDGLNAAPWSGQARSELRAAGEAVRTRERSALEELSPQQLQIARFVAEGATNREVAAQLFLSPRTVDHHLRNVFAKLGIRSRVELARMLS
ncbi:hypothetical protein CDO52_19510 [Nocardiopsis gilva YIM 90087]|uniref:HTH luxR-type domain-containing protein n=1 Tax=Nocardiopsis gilva YIM 90087 TaxID=1235441 RepID=A0A223S9A4_9ACTN|nr:hypothetical protein CDO52_19510 [Nocardiopsis gilva YIM 90087]